MAGRRSRKLFEQIKDDSSSLHVLVDSDSFITRTTQTSATSKLSMNFAFDEELLQHRIYKTTLRSLMRKALRTRSDRHQSPSFSGTTLEIGRHPLHESWTHKEARSAYSPSKVVFLGSLAQATIKSIQHASGYGKASTTERIACRDAIRFYLLREVQKAMRDVKEESQTSKIAEFEENYCFLGCGRPGDTVETPFNSDVRNALHWCASEYTITRRMQCPAYRYDSQSC